MHLWHPPLPGYGLDMVLGLMQLMTFSFSYRLSILETNFKTMNTMKYIFQGKSNCSLWSINYTEHDYSSNILIFFFYINQF